ncbi:MAG: efflux RND transporter periplasmic adaptor subunit [Cyanobacteria bacterium SZAS-4]|nr:efflux RND transporter periplasmic adaptor subunit [Cyanobacteria bacterium SZAS-4]
MFTNNRSTLLIALALTTVAVATSSCGGAPKEDTHAAAVHPDPNAPQVIKLTPEATQQADVKTDIVQIRPISVPLHLTGRIEPDFGKEVDVSSRISGKVTDLLVKPGQFVSNGQVMAVIDSREISELEAEVIESKSKYDIAKSREERERQIYEELIARPKALIEAKSTFRRAKVQKDLAESEFKRVEGLYKEKISAQKDYVAAQAKVAQETADYDQALLDLQRETELFKNKSLMKRDYQLAVAETLRDRQHLNTLTQRLEFLGTDKNQIADLVKFGKIGGTTRVLAPETGVVSHFEVAAGESIHPDKSLFKITDLSTVIVSADLPEADLQRVKQGSTVKVKIASYPDKVFPGVISFISEHVHPDSRTVSIRARLDNKDKKFRTNMFAEIDLEGQTQNLLSLPKQALQEHAGQKIVFVLTKDGFEERKIKVGKESEDFVEVVSGVEQGEKVATQGSLMLKTELTYQH